MAILYDLPEEIVREISSYLLRPRDMVSLSCVARSLNRLVAPLLAHAKLEEIILIPEEAYLRDPRSWWYRSMLWSNMSSSSDRANLAFVLYKKELMLTRGFSSQMHMVEPQNATTQMHMVESQTATTDASNVIELISTCKFVLKWQGGEDLVQALKAGKYDAYDTVLPVRSAEGWCSYLIMIAHFISIQLLELFRFFERIYLHCVKKSRILYFIFRVGGAYRLSFSHFGCDKQVDSISSGFVLSVRYFPLWLLSNLISVQIDLAPDDKWLLWAFRKATSSDFVPPAIPCFSSLRNMHIRWIARLRISVKYLDLAHVPALLILSSVIPLLSLDAN